MFIISHLLVMFPQFNGFSSELSGQSGCQKKIRSKIKLETESSIRSYRSVTKPGFGYANRVCEAGRDVGSAGTLELGVGAIVFFRNEALLLPPVAIAVLLVGRVSAILVAVAPPAFQDAGSIIAWVHGIRDTSHVGGGGVVFSLAEVDLGDEEQREEDDSRKPNDGF